MSAISASLVKQLRDRTGLGMMDCKKALVESEGDIDQAIENLRKNSALKAAKKSSRVISEGALVISITSERDYGVMIDVNSETDFVARNEKFQLFLDWLSEKAMTSKINTLEELLSDEVEDRRQVLIQELGENIGIRRLVVLSGNANEIYYYLHSDKKKGTLLKIENGSEELGRDIAMHITAIKPLVVTTDQLDSETLASERSILESQVHDLDKPTEVKEKMVEGRMRNFIAEVTLTEQPFVKDGSKKVKDLLKENNAICHEFIRYEVGEGIEKNEKSFSDEVSEQLK